MVIYSIIQKSRLEGAKRLDAEYYQPEYLETRKLVSALLHTTLGEVSNKFKKGIFDIKADTYIDEGIPFIRISNLKNGLVDETDVAFISVEANEKEKKTSLQRGDFALSKTAYPAASLITLDEVNISQDIIGVSLKKEWQEKILAPFVVAFLNSKFGIAEMQQWFQGNVQMHLSLPDAKTILIPLFPLERQEEIAEIFRQAEDEFQNSKSLYSQAEKVLLEELGLLGFEANGELWNIVNLSDVKTAGRMDAEYFQPKYRRLEVKLKKYGSKKLLDVLQSVAAKFIPELDKTYRYVELADIDISLGVVNGCAEVLGKEAPSRARRLLKAGDVIVSSVQGSLDKAALVRKEYAGAVASTGFFQFRSREILPEVLLVLSKSIVLQSQFEQRCAGTILTAVPKESIKDILIPIPPEKVQQKIAEFVRRSHESRRKAKALLDEAKRKVEELIEARK